MRWPRTSRGPKVPSPSFACSHELGRSCEQAAQGPGCAGKDRCNFRHDRLHHQDSFLPTPHDLSSGASLVGGITAARFSRAATRCIAVRSTRLTSAKCVSGRSLKPISSAFERALPQGWPPRRRIELPASAARDPLLKPQPAKPRAGRGHEDETYRQQQFKPRHPDSPFRRPLTTYDLGPPDTGMTCKGRGFATGSIRLFRRPRPDAPQVHPARWPESALGAIPQFRKNARSGWVRSAATRKMGGVHASPPFSQLI